ncbi:putative transport protein [Escherichia coli]|nr:putative transport protein [Escherichia coli]
MKSIYPGYMMPRGLRLLRRCRLGMPIFDPVSILTMTAVLIIVFIESMGMFLALGEIVGRKLSSHDIIRGLACRWRRDNDWWHVLTASPTRHFLKNVGLVSVTRVHSRWVCISSGIILILFGMVPKMAVLVASIPQFVLGGAGLVMFGMVLATGIRILSRCNYTTKPLQPLYCGDQSRRWHDSDALSRFLF